MIYLARHGQTEWNAEGKMQGSFNDSPLTDLGLSQANEVGAELAILTKGRKLTAFVSPMERARRSYELIRNHLKNIEAMYYRSDLVERNLGEWEGKQVGFMDQELNDRYEANKFTFAECGVEPYAKMWARLEWFSRGLEPDKDYLIVSHRSAIGILTGILQHVEWDQGHYPANNEIVIFDPKINALDIISVGNRPFK